MTTKSDIKVSHVFAGFAVGILLTVIVVLGFKNNGEWLPRCYADMSVSHCYTVSSSE